MSSRNRLLNINALLLLCFVMGACSFKKDHNTEKSPALELTVQTAPQVQTFCASSPTKELTKLEIVSLSSSSDRNDLCEVWNYIQGIKVENSTDLDRQIVDNFSASLNSLVTNSQLNNVNIDDIASFLTKLSSTLKSDLKNIISINNNTKNYANNVEIASVDNITTLFKSTEDMSVKEFASYLSKIQNKITKKEFCTDSNLKGILRNKYISPHTIELSKACDTAFSPIEVAEARSHVGLKVSEIEIRFFNSAIKSKLLIAKESEDSSERSVIIAAVMRNDQNLFRLLKPIVSSRINYRLADIAWLLEVNADVEPFIKGLRLSDLEDYFNFESLQKASSPSAQSFDKLLTLFTKYNFVPNKEATASILREIERQRSVIFGVNFSANATVSIYKWLRSNTYTGYHGFKDQLKENEFQLLISGRTNDSTVYDWLSPDFSGISLEVKVLKSGELLFTRTKDYSGVTLSGKVYRKIFFDKNLQGLETDEVLTYRRESCRYSVTGRDFISTLQHDSDFSQMPIQSSSGTAESCPQVPEDIQNLLHLATKGLVARMNAYNVKF